MMASMEPSGHENSPTEVAVPVWTDEEIEARRRDCLQLPKTPRLCPVSVEESDLWKSPETNRNVLDRRTSTVLTAFAASFENRDVVTYLSLGRMLVGLEWEVSLRESLSAVVSTDGPVEGDRDSTAGPPSGRVPRPPRFVLGKDWEGRIPQRISHAFALSKTAVEFALSAQPELALAAAGSIIDDRELSAMQWICGVLGNVPHIVALVQFVSSRTTPTWAAAGTPSNLPIALHGLCFGGKATELRALLSYCATVGVSVDMTSVFIQRSLWHQAVRSGDLGVVKLLFSIKAPLDVRAKSGESPLHAVSRSNCNPVKAVEIAEYLLSTVGIPLENLDDDLWTPLHYAAYDNHLPLLKFYIERGAKVDRLTKDGQNLINLCCPGAVNSKCEVLQFLLETYPKVLNVNQVDLGDSTPLLATCFSPEYDTAAKLLIEHGADVNYQYRRSSLLHVATEAHLPSRVKMLIDAKANIEVQDPFGQTPLGRAKNILKSYKPSPTGEKSSSAKKAEEIVQTLVQAGAKGGGCCIC